MTRPHRRMIPLPDAQALTQGPDAIHLRKKKDRFLFMTYNLLAQALVRRDMFPQASQKALRWKFRKQNLLQELFEFGPDLACLQEVDFWEETYLPALTKAGYETAYYKNMSKKHGCAIIWRKSRFEKVDQQTLEYDEHGQPTFTTGNIGLMVALKPAVASTENPDPNADMLLPEEEEEEEEEGDHAGHSNAGSDQNQFNLDIPGGILVATTHLFWRPDGSYERLRQAAIFQEKVNEWNKHLNYTVLIGGDFNTTPRDAAYRAMTRNQMSPTQIQDLNNWLVTEVTRVQEQAKAESEAAAQNKDEANTDDTLAPTAGAGAESDSVDQLTSQTENLALNGKPKTNASKKDSEPFVATIDRPYRAAPSGIKLPVIVKQNGNKDNALPTEAATQSSSSSSSSPPPTIMDSKDFAKNHDPKIKDLAKKLAAGSKASEGGEKAKSSTEDAPVIAPLEAFTRPQDLLAKVESYPRCISIYSQYEALTAEHNLNDNVNTKDNTPVDEKTPEAKLAETTATKARTEHTHGEPVYTNYATWFKDCLDYVYLYDQPRNSQGARLVPLKLLEIPHVSYMGVGLPDENFSSDHFCLLVEFAILAK
ncbi:hypothetical protein BGZ94_007433 [Podila epigama]|nr:hypothetical protein BGZ94_007433 [Podila epigama]